MALKWVNENIHSFGGDKNKITLFGLSSGAYFIQYSYMQIKQIILNLGSVTDHLHVLSPASRGLFQRAILAGATALNPWAFRKHDHLPELFKLGKLTGEILHNSVVDINKYYDYSGK